MAKNGEYLMSLPEAAEKLGWNADSMRDFARENKLTFASGIPGKGNSWVFQVDKLAFERCLAGEQNLFK